MILEIEGRTDINNPNEDQVRSAIESLRTHGPSSFAILASADGSFVQVGGGGVTCVIERKDGSSGKQFRAYKAEKSKVFADGDILSFAGSNIALAADEWLTSNDAKSLFLCFLAGKDLPSDLYWRDLAPKLSHQTEI